MDTIPRQRLWYWTGCGHGRQLPWCEHSKGRSCHLLRRGSLGSSVSPLISRNLTPPHGTHPSRHPPPPHSRSDLSDVTDCRLSLNPAAMLLPEFARPEEHLTPMTTRFSSKTLLCLGSLSAPLASYLLSLPPFPQQLGNAWAVLCSLSSRAPGAVLSFPLASSPCVYNPQLVVPPPSL